MAILWIDRVEGPEIKGGDGTITLCSGDERFDFRMTRHNLRMIVERGRRSLDEAEANEKQVIIKMRQSVDGAGAAKIVKKPKRRS